MCGHSLVWVAVSAALLASAGCVAADTRPDPRAQTPVRAAPQPAVTEPAEFSVRDKETKDKDKRGNTPPGMDRSGGGPTSGAILDPDGAVTKEPVLRER
jgi:hypothetical protein